MSQAQLIFNASPVHCANKRLTVFLYQINRSQLFNSNPKNAYPSWSFITTWFKKVQLQKKAKSSLVQMSPAAISEVREDALRAGLRPKCVIFLRDPMTRLIAEVYAQKGDETTNYLQEMDDEAASHLLLKTETEWNYKSIVEKYLSEFPLEDIWIGMSEAFFHTDAQASQHDFAAFCNVTHLVKEVRKSLPAPHVILSPTTENKLRNWLAPAYEYGVELFGSELVHKHWEK